MSFHNSSKKPEALSGGSPKIVAHDDGRIDLFLGYDDPERSEPFVSTGEFPLALLLAAVFPLQQRSRVFYQSEEDRHQICRDGRPVVRVRYCDEDVVEGLNVFDALVRSPEALTNVLVAAGPGAVEVVGRLLAQRFPAPENVSPT